MREELRIGDRVKYKHNASSEWSVGEVDSIHKLTGLHRVIFFKNKSGTPRQLFDRNELKLVEYTKTKLWRTLNES